MGAANDSGQQFAPFSVSHAGNSEKARD